MLIRKEARLPRERDVEWRRTSAEFAQRFAGTRSRATHRARARRSLPPVRRSLPPVRRSLPPVRRSLPPVRRSLPPVRRSLPPVRRIRVRDGPPRSTGRAVATRGSGIEERTATMSLRCATLPTRAHGVCDVADASSRCVRPCRRELTVCATLPTRAHGVRDLADASSRCVRPCRRELTVCATLPTRAHGACDVADARSRVNTIERRHLARVRGFENCTSPPLPRRLVAMLPHRARDGRALPWV
jgi:hypothetical protein